MSESSIKNLVDRLRELKKEEVKILIFASYDDKEGKDTTETTLDELKNYLTQQLEFSTDAFLASDKKLTHEIVKEHVLKHAQKSDVVLITIFKKAFGPTLGAELDRILEDDEFVKKSILCVERGVEMSDWFTTQPNYRKLARVDFKNIESLKKKAVKRILDKKKELQDEIIRLHPQ